MKIDSKAFWKIFWFVIAAICAIVAQFRMPQVPQKIFGLGVMLGFSVGMFASYIFDEEERDDQ